MVGESGMNRNQTYFMRIFNSPLGLIKRTVSYSTLAALLES